MSFFPLDQVIHWKGSINTWSYSPLRPSIPYGKLPKEFTPCLSKGSLKPMHIALLFSHYPLNSATSEVAAILVRGNFG